MMSSKIKLFLAVSVFCLIPVFMSAREGDDSFQLFPRSAANIGLSYYFSNEMDYVFSLNRSVELDIFKLNILEMWMNFRQNLYMSETDNEAFSPVLIRYDIEYFNLALNLNGNYLSVYSDHICYNTINISRIPRGYYRTYSLGLKLQNEGLRLNKITEGMPVFGNSSLIQGQLHYMVAFASTYNPFGSERYDYKYIGQAQLKYVSTVNEDFYPFIDIGTNVLVDERIKPNMDILLGLYIEEHALLNSIYYHYRYLHDIDGFNGTAAPFHSIGMNSYINSGNDISEKDDKNLFLPRIHFSGGYGKLYNHQYSNHQADIAVQLDVFDSSLYKIFFNTDLSHQSELYGRRAIGGLSPRYLIMSLGPGISYKIPDTLYSFSLIHDFNRYDIGYHDNNILERYREVSLSFSKKEQYEKEDLAGIVLINKRSWSNSMAVRYNKVEHPYDYKIASRIDYFPLNLNAWLPVVGIGASSEIGTSAVSNRFKIRTGIMKLGKNRTTFYLDKFFNSNPDPFRGEDITYLLAGASVEL